MIETIYNFLAVLDASGFAYVLFIAAFIYMADMCFTAQNEVARLRKVLKQAMK